VASNKRAVDLFSLIMLHKGLLAANETLDGSPGAKILLNDKVVNSVTL
jgi:hypothetical protein